MNYQYSHEVMSDANSNSVYGSYNWGEKINDFTLIPSLGLKIKSNFFLGFGVAHNSRKREVNPDEDTPDLNSGGSSGYSTSALYHHTISTDRTISPFVFIQYFHQLSERFCISLDLFTKYDFYKNKTESQLEGFYNGGIIIENGPNTIGSFGEPFGGIYSRPYGGGNYTSLNDQTKTETKKRFLSFGLQPSLRFNVLKNAGLEFTFGLIQFKRKLEDSRFEKDDTKANEFEFGFKLENWLIGFFVKL